jgi:transposase
MTVVQQLPVPSPRPGWQVWERMPGEGRKAFAAFKAYLDLGETRSVRQAARAVGKSLSLLNKWCGAHKWVERARLFDAHMDERKRQAQAKAIEDMAERHAGVACMFQAKVIERLQRLTDAEIDTMSAQDLLSWFVQASRAEARARGLPDVVTQGVSRNLHAHVGPDGGPIPVEIIETVVRTREEVKQIVENLPQDRELLA